MATFRLPIRLGKPDNSGDAFIEPFSIKATNDLVDRDIAVFDDTSTDVKFAFAFRVPKNYVGTPKIGGVFKSTATTNKYKFTVEYRAVADGESGDPSTFQETVNTNPTVPGTALQDQESSVALTAANLAVDDMVYGHIVREGSDTTNDTLAAALLLELDSLFFEYTN